MADVQLSTYQKNIIDTFKSTKDNLFIEALAGCVDCDTEYFNGTEWVRIADYKQGDKVLQYDIDTHEASLAIPILYHKYPCEQLWHFEDTQGNVDQVLCDDHNILTYNGEKIKVKDWLKNPKTIFIPNFFYYNDSESLGIIDFQRYINENINITPYQTKDGYKYCFTMPLGTLILRRNGKIFITGNCGKTFILVELSKLVNTYSVFVAFNKSIQEELKLKITNPKFKTYTFNGLGFMIMNYNWEIQEAEKKKKNPSYKTKSLVIDTYKINNIVSKYLKQENLHQILGAEEYLKVLEDTVHLYDLCRQRLVNMEDIDEISDVIDFYDLYDEYIPDDLVQILQYVTAEDIRQFKEDGVIDFIDQIFITYILIKQGVWELAYFHRFENIFVDECLPGDIYVTCLDDGTEKRIPLKTLYKRYCNNQSLPLAKSFNHATGMYEFKPILNVKKHENRKIYEILTEGLNKIRATDNHKFYTQRGYVEVKDLIIGKDILCLEDLNNDLIIDIIPKDNVDVYDIEVQDNHNFICSSNQYSTGIISHNCQDLSKLQQMFIGLLRRSKTSRYVFVGDKHQCQPAGTKILMRDGSEKNIEDVQIGESVAQYSTQHGLIVGVSKIQDTRKNYIVSDKKSFNVHDLVSVELDNGYKSQYTYNHIAYVRMNAETTKNAVCLYLMYKEDGNLFRIGKVKLYSKSSNTFCLRPRMLSEGFDKAWILNIYDSNKEAWINEQLYSLKYQIPQLIFQEDKISYTLQDIKYIYDNIGGNLFERGISLLHEFNKEFEFPFFERGDTIKHIAKTHGFFLAACNIFPKYMEMGIYNEKNIRYHTYKNRKDTFRGRFIEYHTIQKRTFEHGDFKVYGLTVPYCNTYIADKIVTHNSIYSFAGADCHSTDTIKRLYKTKSLALPVNYRCPSSHLDFVNEKYHIPIQPRPNAPEGEIYKIQYDEVCDYIKPGDCILSRKNKDLCKIALILLDNKFSIYIKDETLVTKLIKKISSFKDQVSTVNELNSVLQKITDEYYQQIEEQQDLLFEDDEEIVEDNTPHEEIVTYSDNSIDLLECVSILLNRYQEDNANNASRLQNIDSFIAYVKKKLCTKDTKDAIQCVSIHQAKGKEYNRVFILNNNKVFKELAHTSDQYEQEKNLVYIAMTRSKDTIFLVGTDPEEETHRYIEPNRLYNDEDDYNEDDELDLIAEQIFQEIDNLFHK